MKHGTHHHYDAKDCNTIFGLDKSVFLSCVLLDFDIICILAWLKCYVCCVLLFQCSTKHSDDSNLCPNCLQMLSVDNKSSC